MPGTAVVNGIPVLLELMLSMKLCPVVIIRCHSTRVSRWRKDKVGFLKGTLFFISV